MFTSSLNDYAQNAKVTCKAITDFLSEIERQPSYHEMADKAADFYDGNQTDAATREEIRLRQQPDFVHNLIAPAIDGVCGLEAKLRTSWVVLGDSDEDTEVADALSHKLSVAARMTRADRAMSDAYKAQLVAGIGWVEVSRNSDPFMYDYRCNYVHRHEIFFDWATQQPDLSDCRWMLRHRLLEVDQLLTIFPEQADLIKSLAGCWTNSQFNIDTVLMRSADLVGDIDAISTAKAQLDQWIDIKGRRIRVYEVYYRHYERATILKSQDGTVVAFDPKNKAHLAAIAGGFAIVMPNVPIRRMRMSYFIGAFRVADMDSHHPHDNFPYVPFFGFREDRTGIPYGLVRRMIPAQEEINLRRRKLTALLNKVVVTKDRDALDNMSDQALIDQLYRPDAVINLNPNRLNKNGGVNVQWGNASISDQQFQVMNEAKHLIQDAAGIYGAYLGQETNATSGVAINSLVEQGTITLGEINDNFRFAKQLVGELLLAHIVQDIGDQPAEVALYSDDKGRKTKVIKLNEPEVQDGLVVALTNAVEKARLRVTVADSTSAPAYRQQMAAQMMQMMGQLPPEYQAALIPIMLEMTDLPNRHEAIDAIKQATGNGDPEQMTPEQQQAAQQQQQEQQQAKQIEMQRMVAELEKLQAEAKRINAEAVLTDADRAKREAEVREIDAKIKKTVMEVVQMRRGIAGEISQKLQGYGGADSQA